MYNYLSINDAVRQVAAKLFNDGFVPDNFTLEEAQLVLNRTAAPAYCKKIVRENEELIIEILAEMEIESLKDYDELYDESYESNGPTGHGDLCYSDADPGL